MSLDGAPPVLWHTKLSHYGEKVRWALDHKRIDHRRRAVPPGAHMVVAYALTRGRGYTIPLMQIDGEVLCDSTAIIAALEQRRPDPPLYPPDPVERRRALELEEFFDEELGPHTRQLGFHELRAAPDAMAAVAAAMLPAGLARNERVASIAGRLGERFAALRYGSESAAEAEVARRRIVAALDRIEAELERGTGDYLVAGRFTVADLTAASLLYPVVQPPEAFPLPDPTPGYERFLAPLRERRGFAWVGEIFARHRGAAGACASP